MKYKVAYIPPFEKQLKRLARKYPSLKSEFRQLLENLENHPDQGISLGNNCYKIRFAIASKNRGKSGGARVIANFLISADTVYLLAIYDKSEKENLSDVELGSLLEHIIL